jgi:hypothetical protein
MDTEDGEPGAIFGKVQGLKRSGHCEVGRVGARFDVEDLDIGVCGTTCKEMAIGVKLDRCKS